MAFSPVMMPLPPQVSAVQSVTLLLSPVRIASLVLLRTRMCSTMFLLLPVRMIPDPPQVTIAPLRMVMLRRAMPPDATEMPWLLVLSTPAMRKPLRSMVTSLMAISMPMRPVGTLRFSVR